MYAVIMTGGKQYKVAPGQVLRVEKLVADIGSTVDFPVLMLAKDADVKVGNPYVANSKVKAEVLEQERADKVRIIKVRRRKHHRKQMGHRQWVTKIKITEIG